MLLSRFEPFLCLGLRGEAWQATQQLSRRPPARCLFILVCLRLWATGASQRERQPVAAGFSVAVTVRCHCRCHCHCLVACVASEPRSWAIEPCSWVFVLRLSHAAERLGHLVAQQQQPGSTSTTTWQLNTCMHAKPGLGLQGLVLVLEHNLTVRCPIDKGPPRLQCRAADVVGRKGGVWVRRAWSRGDGACSVQAAVCRLQCAGCSVHASIS